MSQPPVRKVSQSISEPCVYLMSSVRPCRENTPRARPAVTTTFEPVPKSITFREGMGLLQARCPVGSSLASIYSRGRARERGEARRDIDRSQHQAGGGPPSAHGQRTVRGGPPPSRPGQRRDCPQSPCPCPHRA